MPTNTTLTINSTNGDKKVADKINYVNPDITDQQAINLALAINNLTNNSFVSVQRTDTRYIDSSVLNQNQGS